MSKGISKKASNIIVVYDEFTKEPFPVYIQPGELLDEAVTRHDGVNMQKVIEVMEIEYDKA